MATAVTVKKWGNSMGVILPRGLIERTGLKENDKVLVDVVKEANLGNLFGTLKRKMPGQSFKDMVREGWRQPLIFLILTLSTSLLKVMKTTSLIQRALLF